jgi:putative hemolysin
MCDYSLYGVASRPAKVGDKLVTTHFTNSFTRGFAAVGEPNIAVCLRPGTELAFEQDAACKAAYGFLPDREIGEKVARFRQINREWPNTHHDALEFASGETVLLTRMTEGQHATVLQLPASTPYEAEVEHTEGASEIVAI